MGKSTRRILFLSGLAFLWQLAFVVGTAQAAPVKVDELTATGEKLANVEIMLDNHFGTLKSALYSEARGYLPADPQNPWQYQVYQDGGKKYAVGWILFQDKDSKAFVTNLVFFKEKEPGKVAFIGGATGIDGKLTQVMFARVAGDLPDPVAVLVGSQFVYVGMMSSSPGLMNYDPGKSTVTMVELLSNRIILTLQDSSGGTSVRFFDWNSAAGRFMMNLTATR